MRQSIPGLLEFIGGPFDGFSQPFEAEIDELPECVAIPMNNRSARMFGMTGKRITSDRSAIYRLNYQDGSAHYQFHSVRRIRDVAAERPHSGTGS